MSKIACVYHSIDLDGFMSAAIVKHWFSTINKEQEVHIVNYNYFSDLDIKNINKDNLLVFIGYNYGKHIPDLSEYDRVIMCDISFPKEEMVKLFNKLKDNFIWIDHHISAIKDNTEINTNKVEYFGLRDTKYAACELTWQYFFSNPIEKFGELEEQNPIPEIVRLLGRYDCFGHKGTDEEQKVLEFQYGARQCISNYEEAYKYLLQSLGIIKTLNVNPIEYRIHEKGIAIYQYLCTEAKQAYENGFPITLKCSSASIYQPGGQSVCSHKWKFDFLCINKERFNPINFGIDYHKNGYDGCACFHYANGMINFSLYNDNGKVDCSQIAKQFGGGGHKGAAGFRITLQQFAELML